MKNADEKRRLVSHYLRAIEKDGLVALFHLLHPQPIYILKKDWRKITGRIATRTKINHAVVPELVDCQLLIDNSDSDLRILKTAREETRQRLNRPTILYLMMAQGCNFACTYCPIPALARQYGERLLSFEDAAAGISLWQKHINDQPQDDDPYFLIFYGGEPLLNREVLKRLLAHVTQEQNSGRLPEKLELMLCTNGSLVDEQLSKLLARHKVTVAIGLDGPEEHNDRFRITSDGGPTFSIIKNAISQLINCRVRVVASVTVTPRNVHHLPEYPDFLRSLGVVQFGFNLMKGAEFTRELAGSSTEEYCRSAAQGVLSGMTDALETGQCYEYQLEKKLTALQNGFPFSVDCTCYGNQLVIQADGRVSNCPFLRVDQGTVRELPDNFRICNTRTVERWRLRLPIFSDSMMEQENGVLDGGGCAWSSSELCGDAAARDSINAIFIKEIMNGLIWTLLPKEQADAIRQGKIAYRSYRRVGSLSTTGT